MRGADLIRRPMVVAGVLVAVVLVVLVRFTAEQAPDSASTPRDEVALARIVEFGSDRCVPCRLMKPVLAELRATYGPALTVDFIDVMKDRDAARAHDVAIIPTQVFYDRDGRELARHTGFIPLEEIVATFARHGVALQAGR